MIIFIDDRPLQLVGPKATRKDQTVSSKKSSQQADYDHVVDSRLEALKPEHLKGHVLILNATPIVVEKLISLLQTQEIIDLLSLKVVAVDKKAAEEKIKSLFKVVKAAGGVVFKENKILLIFRRGKWDLPKGKLDEGESSREAAKREVEEETGVIVSLEDRICTTWHTYTLNGSRILKRTKWYQMACLDDSRMVPQADEDIDQIEWMGRKGIQRALTNSYSSIRYVIDAIDQKEPKE